MCMTSFLLSHATVKCWTFVGAFFKHFASNVAAEGGASLEPVRNADKRGENVSWNCPKRVYKGAGESK